MVVLIRYDVEGVRRVVPPKVAHALEMRRLLRLLGRLPEQQLWLIFQLVMAFVTEPKRSRRICSPCPVVAGAA